MLNLDKLRLVWDGEIPISFNLAGDEISTVKQPDAVFVSINLKHSYISHTFIKYLINVNDLHLYRKNKNYVPIIIIKHALYV